MKNFKRQLVPTLIMLFVTILGVTGVTYAWFSDTKQANLNGVTINIEKSSGIAVSDSPTGIYRKTINLSTTNLGEFVPVSTTPNLIDGELKFFKGTIYEEDNTKLSKITAVNSGYYKIDLYFESLKEEKDIYITSFIVNGNRTGLEAMRLAFITHATTNTKNDKALNELNAKTVSSIIEPDAVVHSNAIGAVGKPVYYGLKKESKSIISSSPSNDITDNGIMEKVTTTIPEDHLATVKDTIVNPNTGCERLFKIGKGYTHVTIYFWLEGQDVDCKDHISGSKISISLPFVAVPSLK